MWRIWAIGIGLVLLASAAGGLYWYVFHQGVQHQQQREVIKTVEDFQVRERVDAEVNRHPPSAQRERLRRWMQHDN